jgi:hypothetical protein
VEFQLPNTVASPSQSVPVPVEIQDLCVQLRNIRSVKYGACLGYLTGKTDDDRHGIFWPNNRLIDTQSLSIETLAGVLERPPHLDRKWSNADARRLAVPLAAGVLRLDGTPWLDETWNNSNILLIRQQGKLLADHPFVSRNLETMMRPVAITPGISLAAHVIRNHTLFALGIALIELCMGKPISKLYLSSELNKDGTKHDLSDFQAASRLLDIEEISDRFGQRWSNVVRRCIYCDLNQARTSFGDAGFQQAVYDEILAELEEERREFFQLE